MSESAAVTDRVWPPQWRLGHRLESAEDLLVFDCVREIVADCEKCPTAEGRHKTHLSEADFRHLTREYGPHWVTGLFIEREWNVERGICPPCLARLDGRPDPERLV